MMNFATWAAVLILGPGATAVFIWFLVDLKRILPKRKDTAGE